MNLFLKQILWFVIPSYLLIPSSPFDMRHPDIKKQKLGWEWAYETKKNWLIVILKDFIKQPVIKQSPTFLSFFLIHCYINGFFSFLIKPFPNFEKLIRFHWQAFIVYKNGENLKMLIEIFCRKLIVCNIILAFLDHLTPKVFFAGQPWRPI